MAFPPKKGNLMNTRKRRRSEAFGDDQTQSPEAAAPPILEGVHNDQERLKKEREIWEAFREEHFEVVEQLPLTLHRQFSLMRELDEQSKGYTDDLVPTLRKYLALRLSIAESPASDRTPSPQPGTPFPPVTPVARFKANIAETPRTPTPMGIPPERAKLPTTTREMLSHIAWLSEELMRTGEEKVNLSQAACDSVTRHITLLDQAIQEQEAAIAVGLRPGTHVALPELVIPKTLRAVTSIYNPYSDDDETEDEFFPPPLPEPAPKEEPPPRTISSKAKGRPLRGVEANNSVLVEPGDVISADTKAYCICQKESPGIMVACEGSGCPFEWFHLACIGLTKAPEGDYICEHCTHRMPKGRKSKQQKRRH